MWSDRAETWRGYSVGLPLSSMGLFFSRAMLDIVLGLLYEEDSKVQEIVFHGRVVTMFSLRQTDFFFHK